MKKKVFKSKKQRKIEALTSNLHCCIPETVVKTVEEESESGTIYVVNPDINPNTGNGKKWVPDQTYRAVRDARKQYLKEKFKGKKKSKTPWYYLTKGKCYNYETRKKSWGDMTAYFRVPSETKFFHDKYVIHKLTRAAYIMGSVQHTVAKWEKTHPRPQKTIEGTSNAFFDAEYADWMDERSKLWNATLLSFKNRPKKLLSEYLQHTNFRELANAA